MSVKDCKDLLPAGSSRIRTDETIIGGIYVTEDGDVFVKTSNNSYRILLGMPLNALPVCCYPVKLNFEYVKSIPKFDREENHIVNDTIHMNGLILKIPIDKEDGLQLWEVKETAEKLNIRFIIFSNTQYVFVDGNWEKV